MARKIVKEELLKRVAQLADDMRIPYGFKAEFDRNYGGWEMCEMRPRPSDVRGLTEGLYIVGGRVTPRMSNAEFEAFLNGMETVVQFHEARGLPTKVEVPG